MLADQLDYVIGVDPHRDTHALALVDVRTGGIVLEASVAASNAGYARVWELAREHAPERRAFAIEGAGSFGAGLTRVLADRDERVLEVGRVRRERRSGGKTDALDAVRAARSVLAQARPAEPGAGGEREALRALMAARERAVNAKRAGLCRLRDLLVTTPEPLRSELRPLTRAQLLRRLAAVRPTRHGDVEPRGALQALRTVARRVQHLTAEERELAREIEKLTHTRHRGCSISPASARPRPRRSCSPGRTAAGSEAKPPSPASPAAHRSPPPPDRRSATASTAAATASSTAHCT